MLGRHPHLGRILDWARREKPIRALVATGSLAREDGTADEFSDLDLQVITAESKRYTDDDSWLDELGEVWVRFPLDEDAPYRLVWFAGGAKVDFQFVHPDGEHAMDAAGELSDEYQRGYIVLLDKDDRYSQLPASPHIFPAPPPPSAEQVQATINEFWFEAIHVAQFIRRREFWVAKWRDWTMKEMLLRLLEWRARATGDPAPNTWLLGKRIHEWADDQTKREIGQIWTTWDAADLWRGLLAQLALFSRLSQELTQALEFPYDKGRWREIDAYIRALYAADEGARATS